MDITASRRLLLQLSIPANIIQYLEVSRKVGLYTIYVPVAVSNRSTMKNRLKDNEVEGKLNPLVLVMIRMTPMRVSS